MTTADALPWRTSTRSSNGENCVEVAPAGGSVLIRHSKHPASPTIAFPLAAWTAFVGEVLSGPSGVNGVARISLADGGASIGALGFDVSLHFDAGEWAAFRAGAADGEFDLPHLLATV